MSNQPDPTTPGFYAVALAGIHRKEIETVSEHFLYWNGSYFEHTQGEKVDARTVRRWEVPDAAGDEQVQDRSPWVSVGDRLPEPDKSVWLYNIDRDWVWLGCRAYPGGFQEPWCWAESNGVLYIKDGEIIIEAELEDLDVTHWMPLPEPPSTPTTQSQP